MNKYFVRAAVLSGLVATLALFLGGCPQPTDDSGGSAAQTAADEFKEAQGAALGKTVATVTVDDETAVNAALEAYNGLSGEAKALLTGEKELLDSLQTRIQVLKSGLSVGELAEAFRTDHAVALGKTAGTVTADDEAAVDAALEAYNASSAGVKALLGDEKALLDNLKAQIEALKAAASAAAFKTDHAGVLAKSVETVTTGDEAAVDGALAACSGLSAGARALLGTEKALLDSLKAKIEDLKAAAAFKTDHAGALAKSVGDITAADEAAVNAALAAYEGLSDGAKALLATEKATLDGLQAELDARKAATFKTAHAGVLGKTVAAITAGDEAAVNDALAAYNALSAGARALLTAEKTLLDSLKEKIEELKAPSLAATFKTAHAGVLGKTVATITADDGPAVNDALAAYNALSAGARALLTAEKTLLDSLKEKIEELKITFATASGLQTYLTGKDANDADSPYPVIYTGSEAPTAVYAALEAAGRFVDLDLSPCEKI